MQTATSSRVVIVGGSLGGLRAAQQLRRQRYLGRICVVDAEVHGPYNRTPLSKSVLTEDTTISSLRLGAAWESVADEWLNGSRAVAVHLGDNRLVLDDGSSLAYDGLVVASGLSPRRLSRAASGAGLVLRTFDDAQRLKAALRPGHRVVVLGAGFIGCEVASSAANLGCRVTLLGRDETPLADRLGPALARLLKNKHQALGTDVLWGEEVAAIRLQGAEREVAFESGRAVRADVVVEAIGSTPNVEWLAGAPSLDLSDGVLCDNHLRVEGAERVVAVGDVARFPNLMFDHVPRRFEHWNMSVETARRATRSLLQDLYGGELDHDAFSPLPSMWSDQVGISIRGYGIPALGECTGSQVDDGGEEIYTFHRGDQLVGITGAGATGALIRAAKPIGTHSSGIEPQVSAPAGGAWLAG
jgi:3-phenylpropionate/trans-cinnamate dioxygenase ferredoxin reductase subunit